MMQIEIVLTIQVLVLCEEITIRFCISLLVRKVLFVPVVNVHCTILEKGELALGYENAFIKYR